MIYSEVSENYKRIAEDVERVKAVNNIKGSVRIMAVTKGVSPEKVSFAINEGIDLIGENKVQEFLQKEPYYSGITKKFEIHFIGGLQNNKVKYIIDKVSLVQSADSLKLISEINKRASASGSVMDILLEVNIGEESTKHGVAPDELYELLGQADELRNVRLRGLMAIPPYDAGEEIYAEMNRLFNEAKAKVRLPKEFDTLSMGMSGDYEVAIKHGANIIRIGSALFGSR
jgi:hypothetical protein